MYQANWRNRYSAGDDDEPLLPPMSAQAEGFPEHWYFYRSPWSNQSTSLGDNAELKRQTYAVVVPGVTCRFSPSATDARRQLKAENVRRISPAAEIVYMNWLMTERKMDETRPESAKLMMEFADP
ncbi:hypothetical protein PDIDSM_6966 [Penicillium digitatum]|nr:hypothetical protein PDIDSM_6966 [Penicillium digitatum]